MFLPAVLFIAGEMVDIKSIVLSTKLGKTACHASQVVNNAVIKAEAKLPAVHNKKSIMLSSRLV